MSKSQRDKGARWEREVAHRLEAAMPGSGAIKAIAQTRGGAEAPDVLVPGLFWIECKVGARPPLMRALEQAERDCPEGRGLTALAVVKQDRQQPVVVMRLEDFEEFIGEWWERANA